MRRQAAVQTKHKSVSTEKPVVIQWQPMPGTPQEQAYNSEADILGFGGAAGGGKAHWLAVLQQRHTVSH